MNGVFAAHLRQELLEDRLLGGYAGLLVSRCFDLFFSNPRRKVVRQWSGEIGGRARTRGTDCGRGPRF